jgi:hypothetical protein
MLELPESFRALRPYRRLRSAAMESSESTMVHVLVHHTVSDDKSWRSVFDAALEFRQQGGDAASFLALAI